MKNYFTLITLLVFTLNSYAQSPKKLGFIFDSKTYNFGDVAQWHNQPATYTFTNKTKHPVSILPLFNENDLDVVIPEIPIKIGESVVIKAIYYTAGKGIFNRSFSIYFGSLAEPIILKVSGNIKSLSPEAYINCPMSKPALAKAKIELIGDVAEIGTKVPLSGTSITIIGLQNRKNITMYSSNRGIFGSKLPVGNYQITATHPNYYSYTGPFYIGQTSPPLHIRLTPVVETPVFTNNNIPLEYKEDLIKTEENPRTTWEEEDEPNYKKGIDEEANQNEPHSKDYEKEKPEEKVTNKNLIKPEQPVVPPNLYTFRVIDKKTMDPISAASIFIIDLYNKSNKHKTKSDERGYAEMEISKEDYRFLASADGYISNEIRILKDDRSDVFRIELAPISSLYDEIYETKKSQQKENEDVLDELSFGKTTFSFAKDEPEIKEEERELTRITLNEKENQAQKKEDLLSLVVAQLVVENETSEKELKIINEQKEAVFSVLREQEKVDSLNNYIVQLLAKNNDLEKGLDKLNTEKEDLATKNKETIEELNTKNKSLEKSIDQSVLSKTRYAANNIIFLIDVSTSMGKANKIKMLQTSIKNLSSVLRDIDRLAIIAYNQKSNVVLESIYGNNKEEIFTAIDSLKTGGLTNGVKGLTTAYEMLDYYYIPEGNNQIILATDGLFSKYNNEMTEAELNRLVKKQAGKNMKLTVVGFGKEEEGKDLMMKLAKNGTGQYIQIKNEWMTKDVLIKEIQLNSKKK